jgi:hypothetical protein
MSRSRAPAGRDTFGDDTAPSGVTAARVKRRAGVPVWQTFLPVAAGAARADPGGGDARGSADRKVKSWTAQANWPCP